MMKKLTYKKIDAFTSAHSTGNPAGAIYLERLSDVTIEEMQKIAQEQKGFVSEVGFIWEEGNGSFGLRYYSSEREVEFCGHATIAILYDLIKCRADLLAKNEVIIQTKSALLHVKNQIPINDSIFITAPEPLFIPKNVSKEESATALDIQTEWIEDSLDIAVIEAGLKALIVPLKSLEKCLHVNPNLDMLNAFCHSIGVDIVVVFTNECFDATNSYRTRVFAPTFGYLEDPATGSGNSAFGHYLLKRGLWNGAVMSIEQNVSRENFNTVKLMAEEGKVLFGGKATAKIEGSYYLT